ncbi:MAG: hypothetical protein AAGA76_07785 [Pseudomonadota bacterium]
MNFRYFLKDASKIDAEDVIMFRREIFDDMVVSINEAESVFALNDEVSETCLEWDQFFVEVMTDYCVFQAKPQGYVTETIAEWLIGQIAKDGHVQSDSELELLIKIIERAKTVPDQLSAFALKEVAHAVLEGNGKLIGNERLVAGVIGEPEAKLIRRVMYGAGEGGRIAVSKEEVEVLFDLNDKTVEIENHPEWNDVFVKAVAAHLMMAVGYKALPREEVMRRQEWLDDTSVDVAGMLSKTLSSFGELFRDNRFATATTNMQDRMDAAWRKRNREDELDAIGSEPVDHSEASWLVERIGRDGVLHENEKALIRFLKEESPQLDASLQPLLDKVA